MSLTQPNLTYVGWVELDLCDGLGWVEFFFNPSWWVGLKNPLNPTHAHPYLCMFHYKRPWTIIII